MAERRTTNYSFLVKREGERLLKCLKDPNMEIISCVGWEGMGRWRITDYATNNAMESHHFDFLIQIYVPRDECESRWKLHRRIGESLGIQTPPMDVKGRDEESETNIDLAVQIYKKLRARKFLLVLGGASWEYDHADLEGLGVPIESRWSSTASKVLSKVVLVGKWRNINSDQELNFVVEIGHGTPSVSDVWEFFHEEAALAAHSPNTKGYFSPDTVMNFLLYFSLVLDNRRYFASDARWLTSYFIAEEFIGGEMENDEDMAKTMEALLMDLIDRSILCRDYTSLVQDKSNALIDINRLGVTEGLPNFRRRFWIERDSLPEENDDKHGWGSIQRMSFLNTGRREIIQLPPSPKCLSLSTLFLRYELDQIEFPVNFFHHMVNLKVLDLGHTPIEYLPSSLSSLRNLKLLSLKSCKKLKSLPTSLRALIMLEFLNLSECDSLKMIPEDAFELMDRLQILDLSETPTHSLPSSVCNLHNLKQLFLTGCTELTFIPEKCFERVSNLRVLDLYNVISLKSLPSSLSSLVNLKHLNLYRCSSLEKGVWPQPLQNLSLLEVLDLSFCNKLEDIREASFQNMLPNLRQVYISNTETPNQLSFRCCQSIKILRLAALKNLEILDLSGTKLEKLDLRSLKYSLKLKHLDILPIRYSDVLSEELNWGDADDVGARIWVSDPRFFESTLDYDSGFFEAPCFSRFYIRISPYEGGGGGGGCNLMHMDKIRNIHLNRGPFGYKGIYSSHSQTHLFPYHFKSRGAYGRHMEVCGGNSSPLSVRDFLIHTELITIFDNNFVKRVTDLCSAAEFMELKECRIGICERMENIFVGVTIHYDILRSLEVIWASDLPQLTAMCGGVCGINSFSLLKHIYLQCCPKLVSLFTSAVYLQSLETLDIRFCCRLENVFQEKVSGKQGSLQSLRELCLLHLPKLKGVCSGFSPQLQKVRVRNCLKLRKLPIQVRVVDRGVGDLGSTSSSLPVVEIAGEMEWWENLEWARDDEDDSIKVHHARFRPMRHASATI